MKHKRKDVALEGGKMTDEKMLREDEAMEKRPLSTWKTHKRLKRLRSIRRYDARFGSKCRGQRKIGY